MTRRFSYEEIEHLSELFDSDSPTDRLTIATATRQMPSPSYIQFLWLTAHNAICKEKLQDAKVYLGESLRLAQMDNDSYAVIEVQRLRGHVHWKEGDTDEARRIYRAAIDAAHMFASTDEKGGNRLLARALYSAAQLELDGVDKDGSSPCPETDRKENRQVLLDLEKETTPADRARALLDEALTFCPEADNQDIRAYVLQDKACLLAKEKDYIKAEIIGQQSLEIRRQEGHPKHIAASLHGLAWIAHIQGKFEEAKRFEEERLMYARRSKETGLLAGALYDMAHNLGKNEEWEEARQIGEEGLSIARQQGKSAEIYRHLLMMGWIEFKSEHYNAASVYYKEAATLSVENNRFEDAGKAYSHLGLVLNRDADHTAARAALLSCLNYSRQAGLNDEYDYILLRLAITLANQGENEPAAYLIQGLEVLSPMLDVESAEYNKEYTRWWLPRLRRRVGWRKFRTIVKWSRSQTLDALVTYALEQVPST